jgi:hypothetical protein
MAEIRASDDVKVYKIQKFLGLNESPDGDTQLKMGEASEMRNWRVTNQNHLKVRPGFRSVRQFDGPVRGMWSGYVGGEHKVVCAAGGGLWELSDEDARRIGDLWDDTTTFFGFGGKLYVLNGHEYLVWDGDGYADTVDGYVPLVFTAIAPGGGGTAVENINRLTGRRRVRFSADGKATTFQLPEGGILYIDRVLVDLEETGAVWLPDAEKGTVTFETAPAAGNSNIEVWYCVANTRRHEVEGMRFAEQFNGAADTRVFLYGDGSAKALYCGVTETGEASAEYFPDLYEIRIGGENSPISGMIKYYDRLMSYKPDGGAFSTAYEVTTLADGTMIPGFKTVSINREIGNTAPGQVKLVKNVPRTMFGGNLYDWVYANYATRDERNAKLISQRIQNTLKDADPEQVFTFDDDSKQEYYLFLNDEKGTALVHNYQVDVWYCYTGLRVRGACKLGNEALFGLDDGRVVRFSENYPNDDGQNIDAFFASGNMAFDKDYMRKHSSVIWVSMQPSANANLIVTARSDRRNDYMDKAVSHSLSSFWNFDFGNWSFMTDRAPQMERLKLKVKKFVYFQLILKSNYRASDATVLAVDMRVRHTGYVK